MTEQIENTIFPNEPSDRVYIIKARFKADKLALYGQLIIILTNHNEPESYSAIISTHSDIYDMELHTNWDKYEEFIAEQKWKGNFDLSMTTGLTDYLDEMKSNPKLYKAFYESVQKYNYSQVDVQLLEMISRVFRERDILLESVIQEITAEEYLLIKDDRSRAKPQDKTTKSEASDFDYDYIDTENIGDDAIILEAKAVLSPVKGKPISNLKIGDKIMVKILDTSPKQNAYIKLMGLKDDVSGTIKPIPGDVIDLKFSIGKNEVFEILAKIEEGMFVRIIETEKQVKLRMYDPSIDDAVIKTLPKQDIEGKVYTKEKNSDNSIKVFIIILAVFLVGMTATFLYLLLLWDN